MSGFEAVAAAVLALAPEGTILGEIPDDAPLPWRSMRVRPPAVSARSDASPPQAYTVRVSLLLSAPADAGVLMLASEVHDALEGARPVVDGWSCGPLLSRGVSEPYSTDVTVHPANRRLVSLPMSFEFTCSRLPEVVP